MGQTSYSLNAPAALPGLVADIGPHEIVSKKAEGAFGFGLVVCRGTADDQAKINDTDYIGISVRDLARENNASGDTAYVDEDVAAVMRKGYIWCVIADTGSPGAVLNFVNATGAIGVGAAGAGETDLTGWTLESTVASGGDLGLVRIP